MPGVDLAERRIWNPVTKIASAGHDLIVGASDKGRRAPDPAGFCVDVDLQMKLHLPRRTLPVRAGEMPWASASRCAAREFRTWRQWLTPSSSDQEALARAVLKAAVHHRRSSIIVPAGTSSSASPASTSP